MICRQATFAAAVPFKKMLFDKEIDFLQWTLLTIPADLLGLIFYSRNGWNRK
jgi:hypothetical protein